MPIMMLRNPTILLLSAVLLGALLLTPSSCGPLSRDEALRTLGRRLLVEQRLAADAQLSCLDCHQPARGYSDGLATARPGGLNTPPLWDLAERQSFGWLSPELRSLEAAVLRPLTKPDEMGPLSEVPLQRLRADLAIREAYRAAFPATNDLVTWPQTAEALAAAVRAIAPPTSPYGQRLAGIPNTLSPGAQRGERLFHELGCAVCHRAPSFGGDSYQNIGVPTGSVQNDGWVRIPGLRGLVHTAPYFHDGSAATLEAVVEHYTAGGRGRGLNPGLAISPLLLTDQDVQDLVAWLAAL